MFKLKRSLPTLAWHEHRRSPVTSWSVKVHGYVCVVKIVQARKALKYEAAILHLDKDGQTTCADSKLFPNPEEAQAWCKTKIFTKKYMPRRQTLAWRAWKDKTHWTAAFHGYVCTISMHSRNGYKEYWPSVSFLQTSSTKSKGESLTPFYTLIGARIWCIDYLIGQDLPIKFPIILLPGIPWRWLGISTIFMLLVIIAIASSAH